MGSGKYILMSINKHGVENFKKEIMYILQSSSEMFDKERLEVDEDFVKRRDTYNMKPGGSGNHKDWNTFKNKAGKFISCSKYDERVVSGEFTGISKGLVSSTIGSVTVEDFKERNLEGICKGMVPVIDSNGKYLQISSELYKKNKNLYNHTLSKDGTVRVIDEQGIKKWVTSEEYKKDDTLVSCSKDLVSAKDKDGNTYKVTKLEFDNSDLVGVTKGDNNNPSEYKIFNKNGDLEFTVINENFIKFCKDNNLPYGALVKSHQAEGEPIYKKIGSNRKRLETTGMIKYQGWFAKNTKGKLNGKK